MLSTCLITASGSLIPQRSRLRAALAVILMSREGRRVPTGKSIITTKGDPSWQRTFQRLSSVLRLRRLAALGLSPIPSLTVSQRQAEGGGERDAGGAGILHESRSYCLTIRMSTRRTKRKTVLGSFRPRLRLYGGLWAGPQSQGSLHQRKEMRPRRFGGW